MPMCDFAQQDYLKGKWQLLPRECWPADNFELADIAYAFDFTRNCDVNHNLCEPGATACGYKSPLYARWEWHTQKCGLRTFNATTLSLAMTATTVQLVGDSLMVEQFQSLKALMQPVIMQESWGSFRTIHGAVFRVFGTWHLLGHGNESRPAHLSSMFDVNQGGWRATLPDADILVINTGHHWHRVDPSFASYSLMVQQTLKLVAENFRGSAVVYRTSIWGHYGCSAEIGPIQKVVLAEQDKFDWGKPLGAETVWATFADAHLPAYTEFHVVNASITMLRADGHKGRAISNSGRSFEDCLHNCLPGPADHWNWLLFNILSTKVYKEHTNSNRRH